MGRPVPLTAAAPGRYVVGYQPWRWYVICDWFHMTMARDTRVVATYGMQCPVHAAKRIVVCRTCSPCERPRTMTHASLWSLCCHERAGAFAASRDARCHVPYALVGGTKLEA